VGLVAGDMESRRGRDLRRDVRNLEAEVVSEAASKKHPDKQNMGVEADFKKLPEKDLRSGVTSTEVEAASEVASKNLPDNQSTETEGLRSLHHLDNLNTAAVVVLRAVMAVETRLVGVRGRGKRKGKRRGKRSIGKKLLRRGRRNGRRSIERRGERNVVVGVGLIRWVGANRLRVKMMC